MELTTQDYSNIRKLLDRVQVTGVQESMVLAVLAQKLERKIAEDTDGQDVPSTDE